MRQIKFRGLLQSGTFIYGSYVTDGKDYHAILREDPDDSSKILNTPVIPETVGQFTGLQGKNGVDIYEGDILQPSAYLKSGFARCVVAFKKGMFCFEISKPFIASTSPLYRSLGRGKSACNQFAIIGNIHQNPELIK